VLHQAGFGDRDAACAYQALLFHTLGHVMLEAPYATLDPTQATAELTAGRVMYQSLPTRDYPNTAAVAPHLYGSDPLLDGLDLARDHPASRAASSPGRLEAPR
jgi:hypothetical protein